MSVAADDFRFSPRPNRAADIAWWGWEDEAFRQAQQQGRPILLSLSAVWCHWCHVMDETSYSDPRVITLINEHFVAIRVDNDRRPDINRRYNMGGWPTTAFLTETGEVLTGATYLPSDAMLEALRRVKAYYGEHRDELLRRHGSAVNADTSDPSAPLVSTRDSHVTQQPHTTAADTSAAEWIHDHIIAAFDPLHGGFGTEPKFPHADALEFLLLRAAQCADKRTDEVLTATLDHMAAGSLYDHVQDGFFRYATRRDWSAPHYEKMLEDNSRLLLVFSDAAARYGYDHYATTARGVARYLLSVLWQPAASGFSGSQDADERYYDLDLNERRRLPPPFVDTTLYTEWNALAARGLLRAARELPQPDLADPALRTLDMLWERGHGRRGMTRFLTAVPGEQPAPGHVDGLLGDQATMTGALLDAYEYTGERAYLARAEILADWTLDELGSPDGGLSDHLPQPDSPGLLAHPVPAPTEAATMADALLRLGSYTGAERYRQRAALVLGALSLLYRQLGLMAAAYGVALLRHAEPAVHIAVVGDRASPETQRLHRAALAIAAPLYTVQLLDPSTDLEHIVRAGYAPDTPAAAYVCVGSTCLPPTSRPQEIALLVRGESPGSRSV